MADLLSETRDWWGGRSSRAADRPRHARPMRVVCLIAMAGTLAACGDKVPSEPGGEGDDPWMSTEVIASDAQVRIERVSYLSEGRRIMGQVCRPQRAGRFPLVVVNHGGWEGIGDDWGALDGACGVLARLGTVAVMSSYRGEDGSQGSIEFCGGEAADVRRMIDLARTAPYADRDQVVMYGGSHGGCVTVRALAQGAGVRRAASWNGPADMAELYENAASRTATGGDFTPREFFQDLVAELQRAYGGSPAEQPARYAERSTLSLAGALAGSNVPLLLQHGEADDVVPVRQSCRLAAAVGGFTAFHLTATGTVTASAPAACADLGLTWQGGAVPTGSWPGRRYLIVYGGQGHAWGANMELQLQHLLNFLTIL